MLERSVRISLVSFAAIALILAGCKRAEEKAPSGAMPPVSSQAKFHVVSVDVGKTVDAGKRISAPAAEFAPSDTVYTSIVSEGVSPEVTLVARWTYEDGQLVKEDTQVIAPNGPAATEFHIAKPDGFPEGKYKVEVTANGAPAGTREFEVK